MTQPAPSPDTAVTAILEHLTGPSRGTLSWLLGRDVEIWLGADRRLSFGPDPRHAGDNAPIARLHWTGTAFVLQTLNSVPLWVNGRATREHPLRQGDVIEFGQTGPLSRFRLVAERRSLFGSIDDVLGDSIAYLRASRLPLGRRIAQAARDAGHRLAWETTLAFRITVLLAIAGLAVFSYFQYQKTAELRESIAEGTIELQGIAADLARARQEAIRPGDLAALRAELSGQVTTNLQRLEALERASDATKRVIARAYPAVALLQGSYGMRNTENGKMLRHVVSPQGVPLILPNGQPMLTTSGDGPIAEIQFTGTAFLLKDTAVLISNRHVARPWETGTSAKALAARGLEPVIQRFVAYFPGRADPIPVTVTMASDTADLVALSTGETSLEIDGLALADAPPPVGAEIVVIGYPTGLRSLLAQSGPVFLKELQESGETGFWAVAERLSRAGLIAPLASRGIVGQTTPTAIVYDAETTHGGSGGPVLDAKGNVVAVNAAILPEFGGSNLGVPASKVQAFLSEGGGG